MLLTRLAHNEWMLEDSNKFYLARLYPAGKGSQFLYFQIEYGGASSMVLILREVYTCFFWSEKPIATAQAIVKTLINCMTTDNPAELVYEFGGYTEQQTPFPRSPGENLC